MGTLLLVATPIGNLQDFSPRAAESLRNADRIGCEDTRTTGTLLKHFEIDRPLFSLHQHNEHQKVTHIIEWLRAGETIAIVTDAGMPGISDPGFLVTRAVHQDNLKDSAENGIDRAPSHSVIVIPGPDACTTALVASGIPSDRYLFEGFLPHKKGRKTRLEEIKERSFTTVLYESPHRIVRLLKEMMELDEADRWVCVSREMTKKFEEHIRGHAQDVHQILDSRASIKGEFVVVISPKGYTE